MISLTQSMVIQHVIILKVPHENLLTQPVRDSKGSVFNHSPLLMNHHGSCLLSLPSRNAISCTSGKARRVWLSIIPFIKKAPMARNINNRHMLILILIVILMTSFFMGVVKWGSLNRKSSSTFLALWNPMEWMQSFNNSSSILSHVCIRICWFHLHKFQKHFACTANEGRYTFQ